MTIFHAFHAFFCSSAGFRLSEKCTRYGSCITQSSWVDDELMLQLHLVRTPWSTMEKGTNAGTGKLAMPVAAHLTANGGWVEFHPTSVTPAAAEGPSDPGDLTLPTLRPLAWFRFSTSQEHGLLKSYLKAEVAMHGRQTEFLHNHELPWWLGDADTHQVADHWRGMWCITWHVLLHNLAGVYCLCMHRFTAPVWKVFGHVLLDTSSAVRQGLKTVPSLPLCDALSADWHQC